VSGNGDKPDARPGSSNGAGPDRPVAADPQTARDADQTALDTDQTLSDADQSASDRDQLAADSDQVASGRDQDLSNADQRASDQDELAAERELAADRPGNEALRRAHEVSSSERKAGRAARMEGSVLRAQTAAERLDAADRRDQESRERDRVAEERDRAAEARDRVAARFQPVGPAADCRTKAAADRAQATADRARAAEDREQAASDRQEVRAALAEAHLDELTGTYRRGLGILTLQREINRARHSGGRLVLAFVDVDGLKQVNDRHGHAAGDSVLIDVAATIRSRLRSYDPIVRYGGDEFICAFSSFELDEVRVRFEQIRDALEQKQGGCSISVGLAQLESDDTLEELTARGDAALYDARRRTRGHEPADSRPPARRQRRPGLAVRAAAASTTDLLEQVDGLRTEAFELLGALARASTGGSDALKWATADMQGVTNVLGSIERLLSQQLGLARGCGACPS